MRAEQKVIRYFAVVPPGAPEGVPGTYRIPLEHAGTAESRRAWTVEKVPGATLIRTDSSIEERL